jgi:dolichol-phosphate mannosyltransferase
MYNEEESLPQLIDQLSKLPNPDATGRQLEFVFVDDGSRDDTLSRLTQLLPSDWRAQVVEHDRNRGFGAALRSGIAAATGDIIVSYDADCTYPVEHILVLTQMVLDGCTCATANPFISQGDAQDVPLTRVLLSRANSFLYRLVVGFRASQSITFSCAFRAYRADVIKTIQFRSNGFGAASEIMGRLLLGGASVGQLPSTLTDRRFGTSKMKVVKTIREHLGVLASLAIARFSVSGNPTGLLRHKPSGQP